MQLTKEEFALKAINTVRVLSADGVEKANSGHPGMPMGAAPMGYVLWSEIMNYNPQSPDWANRDRFILSAGHGCMFLYSYLYLTGYSITMDDLKKFRQLHSKTAGHPEYGLLEGVEVTTGPLGQGFANGVGMAIGQKAIAARYNKPGYDLFNYRIYGICSDGDLMEGVSAEAASIAGHLQLGNLIFLYDDNHISIEGDTRIAFTEDVARRFEAYGWHVEVVADGNNTSAIQAAIRRAESETRKPSLIKVRTHIAYGSPNKVDTAGAHGSPLGEKELKLTKLQLGFNPEESFVVADDVLQFFRNAGNKGVAKENEWNELFSKYKQQFPDLASEYETFSKGKLPSNWKDHLPVFTPAMGKIATRNASGKVLNEIADYLPTLIGGSADLAPSTETFLKKYPSFAPENYAGRNMHFGIREHAMGSILNGMALTKGLIPYGATFLIFSEYMRPPIRLAAIMKIRPILVYTHDSIGLGEDGTTHQPVEQLISLRSIPNIIVLRPADANETSHAWRVALEHTDGPVALVLTRQGLPVIDQEKFTSARELENGAYILSDPSEKPSLILMATGSEVSLMMEVQAELSKLGIPARVVSMPSWELFEKQDQSYKDKVFPPSIRKRVAVEMGSTLGWHKYVTDEGTIVGMHDFGVSGPAGELMKYFGFTVENIVARAKSLLK